MNKNIITKFKLKRIETHIIFIEKHGGIVNHTEIIMLNMWYEHLRNITIADMKKHNIDLYYVAELIYKLEMLLPIWDV